MAAKLGVDVWSRTWDLPGGCTAEVYRHEGQWCWRVSGPAKSAEEAEAACDAAAAAYLERRE